MPMRNSPYKMPDEDVSLNIALLLLVLSALGETSRGTRLLNNDRLLLFMYLIKNPVILVNVLAQLGKEQPDLTESERFSINSISVNLDPLFGRSWLKGLLLRIAALGYLEVTYRKNEGFVYFLTTVGLEKAAQLRGDYFGRVREFLQNLEKIKSEPTANLNRLLNNIFRH